MSNVNLGTADVCFTTVVFNWNYRDEQCQGATDVYFTTDVYFQVTRKTKRINASLCS